MSLQIVGAGLGRTATLSLKLALEQLGFGPCYHMAEVMMHPEYVDLWVRAADGHPDWDVIFKGYTATVDYPACSYWRELSRFYPEAKILLSVRDADKWFESTQATIFSPAMMQVLSGTPLKEFIGKSVVKEFGERIHDRDFMVAAFQRHNADVEREIPKDRLLVYDAAQGWEPLCAFLEVPVPAAPFPRVNSREEMSAMMTSQGAGGAGGAGGADGPMDIAPMQDAIKARLGK